MENSEAAGRPFTLPSFHSAQRGDTPRSYFSSGRPVRYSLAAVLATQASTACEVTNGLICASQPVPRTALLNEDAMRPDVSITCSHAWREFGEIKC